MKLKRLFPLLLLSLLLSGCGFNPTSSKFANGLAAKQPANYNNDAFVIHDFTVEHPEQIVAVEFTSDCIFTHIDEYNRLIVSANRDTSVTFDERFINLQHIAIKKLLLNHKSVYVDCVIIDIEVTTTTLTSISFNYQTESEVRYQKEAQISFGYNGNELENVVVCNMSGRKDWVHTYLHDFKMKEHGTGMVLLQGNVSVENATICDYGSLDIGRPYNMSKAEAAVTSPLVTKLGAGFYDIDPTALAHYEVNIYDGTLLSRGYYTENFKLYCEEHCPHCHSPHYDWRKTLRSDKFIWTIRPILPTFIDGLPILNPDKIKQVALTTHTETFLSDEDFLVLNIGKNMSVCFDERFSSLELITGCDFFADGTQISSDINVNISVSTPSLMCFSLAYSTPAKHPGHTMHLNIDLSNLTLKSVIAEYYDRGRTNSRMVSTTISNFCSCRSDEDDYALYHFDDGVQLNNCKIEEYDELSIKGDCKINSGYYAIDSKAYNAGKITINSVKAGRGGYYTEGFYDFLDQTSSINGSQNFPDEGFNWRPITDDVYSYVIEGTTLIDGVPIEHPENITIVELTTLEHTHIRDNNCELVVNISRSIDLNFGSEFQYLSYMFCHHIFDDLKTDIAHDIDIDVSISTNAMNSLSIWYDTIPTEYNHPQIGPYSIVCLRYFNLNFDFNNVALEQVGVNKKTDGGNSRTVHTTINNLVSTSVKRGSSDPEGYFNFGENVKLCDCTFADYQSLYLLSNCEVLSGYYDYPANSVLSLASNHCGHGGYYTDAFKVYAVSQKTDSFDYVAKGLSFVNSYIPVYIWTLIAKKDTLDIQKDLDDMTTMEDDIAHSFAFKIAYSYNYPGEENKFQIQMSFDYQGIMNYCLSVAQSWGKDTFGPSDSLSINFYTSDPNKYISYDLIQDKVLKYSSGVSIVDDNPQLPDVSSMPGYKIFTLDLGDLLGEDRENVTKIINPTLYFRIVDKPDGITPVLYEFYSSLHRADTDSTRENAIDYSFSYLLDKYLSMPLYKDNPSLLQCKADLGL